MCIKGVGLSGVMVPRGSLWPRGRQVRPLEGQVIGCWWLVGSLLRWLLGWWLGWLLVRQVLEVDCYVRADRWHVGQAVVQ